MKLNQRFAAFITVLFIVSALAGLHAAESGAPTEVNRDIERLLRTESLMVDGVDILTRTTLLEAYEQHGFLPFWTRPARIRELMELINDSADHGLIPSDYNIDQLVQVLQQQESSRSAEIDAEADILLTESLLRYGYHRRFGKVEGSKLDPAINFRRESFNKQSPSRTLEQAIESSSLADFIEVVAPTGPVYRHLQYKLDLYRDIAAAGGWPPVPEGPTLRQDDRDARVVAIRKRLAVSGDLGEGADTASPVFDQELKDAVMGFQKRHALDNDGIVGKQSIAAMNVPVEVRVDQLRLSLERLRWVNQEAAHTLVAVNIAGFRAFFYKDLSGVQSHLDHPARYPAQ